jgi:hypothetical protein
MPLVKFQPNSRTIQEPTEVPGGKIEFHTM